MDGHADMNGEVAEVASTVPIDSHESSHANDVASQDVASSFNETRVGLLTADDALQIYEQQLREDQLVTFKYLYAHGFSIADQSFEKWLLLKVIKISIRIHNCIALTFYNLQVDIIIF